MKSILASLFFASSFAFAEGGTGITGPDQYYNPDVKCSVRSGTTLYINLKPSMRMTATVYSTRLNRVFHERLALSGDISSSGRVHLYEIEDKLGDHAVAFLAIEGRTFSILDLKGVITTVCQILPGADLDGPRYP